MTPLRIAASALLTCAVSTATGQILLSRLKLRLYRAEWWFLAFVTGSACLSTLIFFLAILRWIYPAVLLALAGALLALRAVFVRADCRERETAPAVDWRWKATFWVAYLAFGVYYLCNAMAPETSPDGTVYHVGLVARYFDRHGFFPMRTNMFANLPAGAEMLFLFAYSFGRHSAAALVHLSYLLAMPFGIEAYARRMGHPVAGIAGSLLFYAAPVVGKDGAIAYNDVLTAAVVFGCFYALQIWNQDRKPGALIPAGLLAGFAFASKYTAFTAAVYAAGFILVCSWRRGEKPWRPLAIVGLLAVLIAGPWMIKNVAYVANPVYPFFSRCFPNPYYAERFEQDLRNDFAHPSGITYSQIPRETTVGGRLTGILGPVFLLAPLALLSLRSAMGRQLLFAFAVVMLSYFGNIGTRFLIPGLPFLALALAAGIAARPAALGAMLAAHLLLSWPSLIPAWAPPNQWRLDAFDWRAALRLTPEDEYLAAHLDDYRAGLMLDRFVPAHQLVYAPSLGQLAYHHRQTIGSNRYMRVLDTLAAVYMPGRSKILRRRYDFAPVRARALRIVLEGARDAPWRIHEIRFFRGSVEWPRQAGWRLSAAVNPWEIPLAFDNSSVSAWISGRRAAPGEWVEADFGTPLELTGVTVEQPPEQGDLPQKLEAIVDGRAVHLRAEETTVEVPLGSGLRRAAAAEIKTCGVEWLLLRDGDFGADDIRQRAPYWGAVEMGREGDFRLWKLR